MWTTLLIILIIDIIVTFVGIVFLYIKGKDRNVPKITDEEYKEFIKWYKNNKK